MQGMLSTVDLVLNNNFFKIYMAQSNPVTTSGIYAQNKEELLSKKDLSEMGN